MHEGKALIPFPIIDRSDLFLLLPKILQSQIKAMEVRSREIDCMQRLRNWLAMACQSFKSLSYYPCCHIWFGHTLKLKEPLIFFSFSKKYVVFFNLQTKVISKSSFLVTSVVLSCSAVFRKMLLLLSFCIWICICVCTCTCVYVLFMCTSFLATSCAQLFFGRCPLQLLSFCKPIPWDRHTYRLHVKFLILLWLCI